MAERKIDYIEACPECKSNNLSIDYERAEIVCNACGLVIDEKMMDAGPEWRAFDHEQRVKRSRTGAPLTYTIHDKGLSTVIDWRDKDSYGGEISPGSKATMHRLRKWQQRIRVSNATERNLVYALSELNRIAAALNLPKDIRERSSMLYRKAVEKGLIRGRSIEGVCAAAIYAACRQCSIPRTLDEIAEAARINRKEIGRTYRFIARELGINLNPTTPVEYVPRFVASLGLSGEVQAKAIEILKEAMKKDLTSGRGPTGVAAAAIYIACLIVGEKRTQREVAEAAGITEVTIRNRYKELAERLKINVAI